MSAPVTKQYELGGTFTGIVEVNADGYVYLIAGKGRSQLVNRLDSFNTSYQLKVLREAGLSESLAR